MKKVFKIFSLMLSLVLLIAMVACSNNDIKGTLEVSTTSTKIQATASFNKNSILSESSTIVTVKLYNSDVTEQLERKTVSLGDEKVQGTVTFEDLKSDTKYVLKLYVSHGGNESLVYEVEATTTVSGSSEDKPIEINSLADFYAIEEDTDAYYKLMTDLDFTDEANVSLCSSSEPFEGVLDGNGHTIKNFTIAFGEYSGLFEYVKDSTIKNLKITDATIDITSTCKFVGALAGYAVNTAITNVKVDGFNLTTSSGATTTAQIGGLVGAISSEANSTDDRTTSEVTNSTALNINFDLAQVRPSSNYLFYGGAFAGRISGQTSVADCKASGVLNVKSRSSSGTAYIGGFAGAIESSLLVSNAYSLVSISVVRYSNTFGILCIGGFAGSNGTGQINLDKCFAFGDIEALSDEARVENPTTNLAAKAYIGGIVGQVTSSPKGVKNCYYAKANFGINVKQADSTQTTNYVDKCFVSTTIAYVSSSVKNKIADVYSYDDCLNVSGMTFTGNSSMVIVDADTTAYATVLSAALKTAFEEALQLRTSVIAEVAKFTFDSYSYTTQITEKTDFEFPSDAKVTILGTAELLSFSNNTLTANPNGTVTYGTIRLAMAGENNTINLIIHVVTK